MCKIHKYINNKFETDCPKNYRNGFMKKGNNNYSLYIIGQIEINELRKKYIFRLFFERIYFPSTEIHRRCHSKSCSVLVKQVLFQVFRLYI